MAAAPHVLFAGPSDTTAIDRAVVSTVAYGDVFEYPLRVPEVHRYLHAVRATIEATAAALARCAAPGGALSQREGFYMLRGRESLVDVRRSRAARATRLWPAAVRYGHVIAGLPFVRLVAVTGSLAWDNVVDTGDIDYLIVTEPDHLWVCRWLVTLLQRLVHLSGIPLCPNYFVTTRALAVADRNLYVAYELACTRPVAGLAMYRRLRRANPWTASYLPNAVDPPILPVAYDRRGRALYDRALERLVDLGEGVLRSRAGAVLERYDMRYRIYKRVKGDRPQGEASYGVDWFKPYPNGHRRRVLAAFAERLHSLGLGA
jgi:hypothetical protein